jgi:hypothetical protein
MFGRTGQMVWFDDLILMLCLLFAAQMSLMASLSNPYIVEYKDGWVDEVQIPRINSVLGVICIPSNQGF